MVTDDFHSRDRGQLLLVGAAAIALVVMGSVIFLNGLQFTDTVGTEGNGDALAEARQTATTIRGDLSELTERVRSNTGLVQFEAALRHNVSAYANRLSNLTFTDSATYVNVSLNESAADAGWLVTQNRTSGPDPTLQNTEWGSGDTYTVARDSQTLGPFNLTISEFPCDTGGPPTNNFTATIENTTTGNAWELRLVRIARSCSGTGTPGTRYIEIYDQAGNVIASHTDAADWFPETGPVRIDLIAGTVNGTQATLHVSEGVQPTYTVTFETNGVDAARGSFWIGSNGPDPSGGSPDTATDPDLHQRMQRPAFTVVYERPGIRYNTTMMEAAGT